MVMITDKHLQITNSLSNIVREFYKQKQSITVLNIKVMKTPFRVLYNDTIKATLTKDGKLIATLYDSCFTRISQVVDTLSSNASDQHKGKGYLCYTIYNIDRDTIKTIFKNRL